MLLDMTQLTFIDRDPTTAVRVQTRKVERLQRQLREEVKRLEGLLHDASPAPSAAAPGPAASDTAESTERGWQ